MRHDCSGFRRSATPFVMAVLAFLAFSPLFIEAAPSDAAGARRATRAAKPPKPCNPRKTNCPDATPPTVSITSPQPGQTLSGAIVMSGTASDAVGVTLVEVRVDEQPFQAATGTAAWTLAVDTTAYAEGAHTLSARARDAAGNVSSLDVRSVTFSNAPNPQANVLVMGAVRVDRPTLHALGAQVLVSGDQNRNGRVDVRYRQAGSSSWLTGPPLMRVMPETITEAVPEQFAGSIFDLDPGTAYEVELHATDADGSVSVTTTFTATTRPVPLSNPAAGRSVSVGDASALRAALTAAEPGDVILVGPGTYAGPFSLTRSGTADRPIVIRGSSDVVLDGNNCSTCNVLEVSGSYVHVEGVTVANAFRGLRFTGDGSTRNVARRLTIRNVVHGTASRPGQSDFYICDNDIDGRLEWPWVFERNATSHWDDRGVEVTGDGHVVCHNRIRGFGDPVVNMKRRARSWDVYGNDIADAWDGVELDEGEGNVRMFHNRFTNVMAPVSIQPIFGGPAYALRNVAFNVPDEQVKLKSLGGVEEPSGALIYHNTFVSPERALNLLSTITQHNFVFANNLFVGPTTLWGTRTVDWVATLNEGLFDFNGYYPDGEFMFGIVDGVGRLFPSFAVAQAGGVETGGRLVTSTVFAGGFVGPADEDVRHSPKDFRLSTGSGAIDRGALLPGINDRFTGSAPDLGALEAGCPQPVYGPRAVGAEQVTSRINCGQ